MPSVQELYELWAGEEYAELKETLGRSLEPRGAEWLFELFASLGPKPGEVVLDIGARNAEHTVRLVREHELRGIALDPVPVHVERAREATAGLEIDVVEAAIESIPLEDASVDWIWCRDVLVHADVRRGLAECARVLKPGGAMVAYVTLATERLEPREATDILSAAAVARESFDPAAIEAAASEAGLTLLSVDRIGSEWRERMIEDGEWDAVGSLLSLARLERRRAELVERYGAGTVEIARNEFLWGLYQMLGKLCPTIYVWERRA